MKLIEMNTQQDALMFDDFEDQATVRAEEANNIAKLLTPPVQIEPVVTALSSTSPRVITAADYSPTDTNGASISIGTLGLIALGILVATFGAGIGVGVAL